jgi:Uma2 family endonuclease
MSVTSSISSAGVATPPVNGAIIPPGNDVLYEVVNGHVVELPPMGAYSSDIASDLVGNLRPFARAQNLGRVVGEMLFVLDRTQGLERRPDVAFVSYRLWPRNRRVPQTRAWDVVPELAIEVISPTNSADEVLTKTREYFQAGVQQVWVVYPMEELAHVYEAFDRIRVVRKHEALDGGTLIPGFSLPLAQLFEEEQSAQG